MEAVGAREPGQTVSVVYLRDGARHTAQVQLAAQPSQASSVGSGEPCP